MFIINLIGYNTINYLEGKVYIMFISEMYKIEKIINSYRMNGVTDVKELVRLRNHHKLSFNGSIYYYCAAIIPFTEMLEHINEYNNTDMEETTEMFWWDRLTEKYNKIDGRPIMFTVNDTIFRFKCVEKLSKSIIYKKRLEELFGVGENLFIKGNQDSEKKLVLSKISKKQ